MMTVPFPVVPPVVEEQPGLNDDDPVMFWNHVGLEMNRMTHSVGGTQAGPPVSARALAILHLAIHDAFFATASGLSTPPPAPYLDPPAPKPADADDPNQAVAGAAVTILQSFYGLAATAATVPAAVGRQLDAYLKKLIADYPDIDGAPLDALSTSYQYGIEVAQRINALLAVRPDEPGADQGAFRPEEGRHYFRDEPSNPVRLVPVDPANPDGPKRPVRLYHAPFYGMTARRIAAQEEHLIADPPKDDAVYDASAHQVYRLGGAAGLPTTKRTPDQTVSGLFWAYDGANLIGTPPRLYNQILRKIAVGRAAGISNKIDKTADYARVFALVNAALGDAGIFAWREKYCFEFWRPLSGIREHDKACGPRPATDANAPGGNEHLASADADPFWLTLGAPDTNTDRIPFKPPFPAYPSGHATFGAAAFQMMRLYYGARLPKAEQFAKDAPDGFAFSMVSEELNGVNRDLTNPYDPAAPISDQPGVVRTRVVRKFKSLWHAIFDNATSRVFLGVHWNFDAYSPADVQATENADGTWTFPDPHTIKYETTGPREADPNGKYPVGGVPLGIAIANDIYESQLKPTPAHMQPYAEPGLLPLPQCGPSPFPPAPKKPAPAAAPAKREVVTPKASQNNIR